MRISAVTIALAATLIGGVAQAQPGRADMTAHCAQEARKLNLRGDAQADFLTRCWAGGVAASRQRCEAEARRQGLAGEDLSGFMRRCTAGEVMLQK
jgi:hypothetical protein